MGKDSLIIMGLREIAVAKHNMYNSQKDRTSLKRAKGHQASGCDFSKPVLHVVLAIGCHCDTLLFGLLQITNVQVTFTDLHICY